MDALKLFQEYMGTGLIVLWFLVSLLYLCLLYTSDAADE